MFIFLHLFCILSYIVGGGGRYIANRPVLERFILGYMSKTVTSSR